MFGRRQPSLTGWTSPVSLVARRPAVIPLFPHVNHIGSGWSSSSSVKRST
jgi:hypothetical protein